MNAPTLVRRVSYRVCIWREPQRDGAPLWRGTLETGAGQCFEFACLEELARLLCEIGGWTDPPYLRSDKENPGE